MQEDEITMQEYAERSHTDIQFINQLTEYGLIEIVIQQQVHYIPSHQLPLLEKYARLHYDLDINMAGIEAISHLLQRVERMQNDMETMRRKLRLFDTL
ncbi:MAG: chaperone modulator CbpM [Bacteroidota bacterium]|nr:chaperone modulator CbpM [Bacteroidota bacterium]